MSFLNRIKCELTRNLLPSYIVQYIREEEAEWKSTLLKTLPEVIKHGDLEQIEFWIFAVDVYVTLETFSLEPAEIEIIARCLYDFICSDKDPSLSQEACSVFAAIMSPFSGKHKDFKVDWRPLYRLIYSSMITHSKQITTKYPMDFPEQLVRMVQTCRSFFYESATDEMIYEWSGMLDPTNPSLDLGLCLFTTFIPVNMNQHNKWLTMILEIWPLLEGTQWDYQFLTLFARLSKHGYTDVPWDTIIPYIYNLLINYLNIPASSVQKPPISSNTYNPLGFQAFFKDFQSLTSLLRLACSITVDLLSGPTKQLVRSYVERLLHFIKPFCTASVRSKNELQCDAPIEFLFQLLTMYTRRIHRQRVCAQLLEPLTTEDHEWLVDQILPLAILELFREVPQFICLGDLGQLAPARVIGPVLEAVRNSFEHLHLKSGAYQTLASIAPAVIHTKECIYEFMEIVEAHVPEDLDFMDISKCSIVFQLLTIISSTMTFGDEHESFILRVTEMMLLFAEHAVGEDYQQVRRDFFMVFSGIIRAVPHHIATKVSALVKQKINDLPDSSLKIVIVGLGVHSIPVLASQALKASDLRGLLILQYIIHGNTSFVREHITEIRDIIVASLNNENKKIMRRATLIVKWVLSVLVSVYPKIPVKQGFINMKDGVPEWHVPTDEEYAIAYTFANFFINIMNKKFSEEGKKERHIATLLARSLMKGLMAAVSENDLEPEPVRKNMKYPTLHVRSSRELAELYEKVMYALASSVNYDHPESKLAKLVLRTLENGIIPVDVCADSVRIIGGEYDAMEAVSSVSVMLPFQDCNTYLIAYYKARHLLSLRFSLMQHRMTRMARTLFDTILRFTTFPDTRIRALGIIASQIISGYFHGMTDNILEEAVNSIQDWDLDPEVLSTRCGAVCCLPNVIFTVKSARLLFNAALALCRVFPTNMRDDAARTLRQYLIVILSQINQISGRFPADEYQQLRKEITSAMIEKFYQHASSRETYDYIVSVICYLIPGTKFLLTVEVVDFLVAIMFTDDPKIRTCAMETFPIALELLIPRVPCPRGIDVDIVTPENYDRVAFVDKPMKTRNKKASMLLTYEQLTDPDILRQFFDDDIEERIAITKSLYEKIFHNDHIIEEFINILINAQVHKEEIFAKGRVMFWCTMCRFFGIEFMVRLVRIIDQIIDFTASIAHHIIAAEIFSGVVRSTKARPYCEIMRISEIIFPFIRKIIETTDPEYCTIWRCSLYDVLIGMDWRRLFWLFEYIMTCVPEHDDMKMAKAVTLITDITVRSARYLPGFPERIEELVTNCLFTKEALEIEHIREFSVQVLTQIMSLSFRKDQCGKSPESRRLLDKFITPAKDIFKMRWLLSQFRNQSIASLAAGGYTLDHISELADMMLDKNETEENLLEVGIMQLTTFNFIGSLCNRPLRVENIREIVHQVLQQLLPEKHQRQVQSLLLVCSQWYLTKVLFFIDDDFLESLIDDRVIPGLIGYVQDEASYLLAFIIKASMKIRDRIPSLIETFTEMLFDKENPNKRIGGAKGLTAVITGTVLFDEVPQYVIDSLTILTDAAEIDSSVEQVVTAFLSEFWTVYEDNLAENVAEILTPFRASLRPSYFC